MATAVWTTGAQALVQQRRKAKGPRPGTFLVTLFTHQRRPVFSVSRVAEGLIESVLTLRMRGSYNLHAFLVLPDRVHLLMTPLDRELKTAVEEIEAEFARHVDSVRRVWESGFEKHPVRSIRDLERLRTHLHELPVRALVTESAEQYPYSSASRMR